MRIGRTGPERPAQLSRQVQGCCVLRKHIAPNQRGAARARITQGLVQQRPANPFALQTGPDDDGAFRGIEIPFSDDLLTSSWILLALAYTVRRLPYALRSCVAALQQLHVSLEEAAENLGATKGRTIRRVVVPLMAGGMVAGFIISFMTAAVELSTTLMLVTAQHDAPMSYGIYLYMQSAAGRGPGAALGVLAVALVAAGTYTSYRLIGSRGNLAKAQEIQTMGV